jgi:hypothetical protein
MEVGDRYCEECRCAWCGGDASDGETSGQGWPFCNETCKAHFFKVKEYESHEVGTR